MSLNPFQLLKIALILVCLKIFYLFPMERHLSKKNSGISPSKYLSQSLRISIESSHWTCKTEMFGVWETGYLVIKRDSREGRVWLWEGGGNSPSNSKISSHQR